MKKITAVVLMLAMVLTLFGVSAVAVSAETPDVSGLKEGWNEIEGKTYYVKNGEVLTGRQNIKGYLYLFDEDGVQLTGLKQVGSYLAFFLKNKYYDGRAYYGKVTTGGKTYDFTNGPIFLSTGWWEIDGVKYYFIDGALQTGIVQIGKGLYFFDENGIQDYGFKCVDGKYYFFQEKKYGGAAYSGLVATKDKKIYNTRNEFYADGPEGWTGRDFYVKDGRKLKGLQEIGKYTYYFDEAGDLQTGFRTVHGKDYYFVAKKYGGYAYNGKVAHGGKVYDVGEDFNVYEPVYMEPVTEKVDESETVTVTTDGTVKEASVPGAVVNEIFDKVFEDSASEDKSLTLVLNVEETGKTDTEFNYEIDMDAIVKEISGGEVVKSGTYDVNDLGIEFKDYVEVQINIAPGLNNVQVKHNGEDMTEVESKEDIPAENANPAGYFNYAKESGLLRLWITSFSPFTVSGTMYEARIIRDGEVAGEYTTIWDGLKAVTEDGDVLQIVSDVTGITETLYLNACKAVGSWATGFVMEGPTATKYTIDLNGHTVSGSPVAGVFQAGPGQAVEVTFMDSSAEKTGKVIHTTTSAVAIYQNGNMGKVIIESGTYIGGKASLYIEDTVEIKGGNFENTVTGYANTHAAVIATGTYADVYVSGGTFAPVKHFIYGKSKSSGPDVIAVSGGKFIGLDKDNIFVNVADRSAGKYTISITGGEFEFDVAEAFPNYVK